MRTTTIRPYDPNAKPVDTEKLPEPELDDAAFPEVPPQLELPPENATDVEDEDEP